MCSKKEPIPSEELAYTLSDDAKHYIVSGIGTCKDSHIVIPDSVTTIESSVFAECNNLTNIIFDGTTAEWNAIEKGQGWDAYTADYTIHCTDGDIAKD